MEVSEISVEDLKSVLSDASFIGNVVIVDVREPHEFELGRVPGARLVPLGTVPNEIEAFTGSPTYVICRSGARSHQACDFLLTEGLEVVNVAGGTMAWIDAGFEVETGSL